MSALRLSLALPFVRAASRARPLAALLLAAALLSLTVRSIAGTGDPRTLIVRGRVLAPDGAPVAGAVVSARGSANTSATSDDRGRYSFTVPIGSAGALRRGAFALEVRAEAAGRRLAFGGGASALGIEVALAAGGGRVRVRSNSQSATSAIASAFAQQGEATAWVDADFGGASRPGGAPVLRSVDEVPLDGSAAPAPRQPAVAPAPRETAVTLPRPEAQPVPTPRASAAVSHPAKPTALRAERHETVRPDTEAIRLDRLVRVAGTVRAATHREAKARRDSTRAARSRAAHAQRLSVSVSPETRTETPAAPAPGTRVVGRAEHAEAADSCACRVRGTVEVDWDRPLERDFPVELTLEGPATQHSEVEMFIGSPREFRFGPLPCGEYRLLVRARGRLHYTLERGDSVVSVSCHGLTQPRVLLVPARR